MLVIYDVQGTGRRGRLSNKSLETALAPIATNDELNRKIALATECFTTTKSSELILKDRARLSEENAITSWIGRSTVTIFN